MTDKWHGGKGSRKRPTDQKKFNENWDRIFKKDVELDPADREWEYDGDGAKIYKLEAGKPTKTPYQETDLDGGVPFKKN